MILIVNYMVECVFDCWFFYGKVGMIIDVCGIFDG